MIPIGCFALITPFQSLEKQFIAIEKMGIRYADITDNHDGATLGVEYGFSASASLESHPDVLLSMVQKYGISLTSVCAHANLLDPASPSRYGTSQIIKAIKLAHFLGVRQVVTTEGEPRTEFGHQLSFDEKIFSIREKLYEPIQWAKRLGIELLLETHGPITGSLQGMRRLLEVLGESSTVGVNLDTGNCWLGGEDPMEYLEAFGDRIKHVHWKDMGSEWVERRGSLFGCGMGYIPLGQGVVGIQGILLKLKKIGFDGPTTIEVTGEDNVRKSRDTLAGWWNEIIHEPVPFSQGFPSKQ